MKYVFNILCALLVFISTAHAAPTSVDDTMRLGMSSQLAKFISDNLVGKDADGVLRLPVASGKSLSVDIAGTPVMSFSASGVDMPLAGFAIEQPVYVPTFAATPAAGTNDLKVGFNAVPTAAANTAACLPAVPDVGDTVEGFNSMANTVRVKACGTPGINGAAAGTYIPLATMNYFRCTAETATAWRCGTLAVPTPAGP